jgi:hypothetical protein
MKTLAALVVLAAFSASAQDVPAGFKLVKDRKQACQMVVPSDWTGSAIMPSNLTSPDKKASVVFGSKPPSQAYADLVKMAKSMFKPVTMIEENDKRTWYVSETARGKSGTSWYVALNTSPLCEAQVEFQDAAFEAKAKQMVNSLKATK